MPRMRFMDPAGQPRVARQAPRDTFRRQSAVVCAALGRSIRHLGRAGPHTICTGAMNLRGCVVLLRYTIVVPFSKMRTPHTIHGPPSRAGHSPVSPVYHRVATRCVCCGTVRVVAKVLHPEGGGIDAAAINAPINWLQVIKSTDKGECG